MSPPGPHGAKAGLAAGDAAGRRCAGRRCAGRRCAGRRCAGRRPLPGPLL